MRCGARGTDSTQGDFGVGAVIETVQWAGTYFFDDDPGTYFFDDDPGTVTRTRATKTTS